MRLSLYFSVLAVAICLVFCLQFALLSNHDLNSGWDSNLQPRDTKSADYRKAQWMKLLQLRQQPTWKTTPDGAFIHIGKTAGSSLSILLTNGCHSFMPKPCRTVPDESMISKKVKTYFHGTCVLCQYFFCFSHGSGFCCCPLGRRTLTNRVFNAYYCT